MTRPPDPFRTLDVPRDATLGDVKAAYRRLAKLYHPDSAGPAALPRFLAIQAAYETLTEGPTRIRMGASRPRPASRTRRSADGGPEPERPGPARGSAGRSEGRGGRTPGAETAGSGASGGGRARRARRTPASTSYDGVEAEPFEPEWEGASWYGGSSGTYWTLNPKEFADPRKHGPEYLARGRRDRPRPGSRGTPVTPGATRRTAAPGGSGRPPDDDRQMATDRPPFEHDVRPGEAGNGPGESARRASGHVPARSPANADPADAGRSRPTGPLNRSSRPARDGSSRAPGIGIVAVTVVGAIVVTLLLLAAGNGLTAGSAFAVVVIIGLGATAVAVGRELIGPGRRA
ncbi:MAG: DnaJ domain-containing protein [Chloroflexi bacterium]|nr:DnaJ domain-containing protein [Chloroflexota bacterium]